MNPEIRNAVIKSTMLGYEDHGIFSCMLYLDYGGSGQGFGGYGLDTYDNKTKKRKGTAYGLAFIAKILDTLEIEKWEDLPNTHCRADATFGKINGIGHILKDQWFYPETDLKAYLKGVEK